MHKKYSYQMNLREEIKMLPKLKQKTVDNIYYQK